MISSVRTTALSAFEAPNFKAWSRFRPQDQVALLIKHLTCNSIFVPCSFHECSRLGDMYLFLVLFCLFVPLVL
jgi:hypothetical protein